MSRGQMITAASLLVADGGLLLWTVLGDARHHQVRAYDPVSGEPLWERNVPWFAPFRAFADVLVYESEGYTRALAVSTGRDLWRVPGKPTPGRGGGASTDHDAVGRTFTRLDLVRDGEVTSFAAPGTDADEAVSMRDGLVGVTYECRSVEDLLD